MSETKIDRNEISDSFILDEDTMVSDSATKVASQQSIKAYVDAQITAAKTAMRIAVGDLHFSTSATNPGTSLGYGTWVAWGGGRVPLAIGNNGVGKYPTVEATGGVERVAISNAQMPVHSMSFSIHGQENGTDIISQRGTGATIGGTSIARYGNHTTYAASSSRQSPSWTWGKNKAHENRMPYITCYMWKRTA